ncbi:MAG TPA: CNNM domain-containing protein [Candidatus Binatia bacterium]|nr:CNNM domain-containing protein [Candidatus Binatia bacterium]
MEALLPTIFIVCLMLSFLLSGMEAGVLALSRIRIRQQMRAGNPRAKALYEYLENPEPFLWTILVGNTLANFAVVSIGAIVLDRQFAAHPVPLLLAFCAGVVLFYTLFELLPKILFRLYPNRLCMFLAIPFRLIHFALRPLVALMTIVSDTFLRWTGGKRFTGHLFGNRDELRLVMQESAQSFTSEERVMINRVLDLQNLSVGHVAVPLSSVVMVEEATPVNELFRVFRERAFSRVPVWRLENKQRKIVGIAVLKTLIFENDPGSNQTARDFLKSALFLDSEMRLERALRQMQRSGQRLAIVLDRSGRESGIISLHDILQVIFGLGKSPSDRNIAAQP